MSERDLGKLFIVAAPSGGGKTSLVHKLVMDLPDIEVSISHTTRSKRPNETPGQDYFFIEESAFLTMIEADKFVEHAHVFNHYYGTSKAQIQERLKNGIDVVLDIDWQGAQQIRDGFPNSVSIFVIPPSLEVLKDRLQSRKQDAEDVIEHRMQQAKDELSHYHEFDYLIVNDEFEKAARDLQAIVVAHRLQMKRQACKQRQLLSFLLASK